MHADGEEGKRHDSIWKANRWPVARHNTKTAGGKAIGRVCSVFFVRLQIDAPRDATATRVAATPRDPRTSARPLRDLRPPAYSLDGTWATRKPR